MLMRFLSWMYAFGIVAAHLTPAGAQDYPNKPVRILTSEAGGSSDFVSRVIAQGTSGALGRQVIVENRAGIIAIEIASKASPDGYTLVLNGSIIWIEPLIRDDVPYDALRDFAPIVAVTRSPNLVVVHPTVTVTSIKELIEFAKGHPGKLDYGSAASGSSTHIAAELFKSMAGVDIRRIPYKGNGPAILDLLGGQVQLMFPIAGSVATHLKSGRLKALAVTSAQPSPLLPGLATVAESGLPGYESVALQGMFAPARTPRAIISRLNQEVVRALRTVDIRDRFLAAGVETVGSSPEEFAATVKSEIARLGKLIKALDIRGK